MANLKALSALLGEVLLPHPSVAHVRSSVVLDTLKSGVELPLDALEQS